MISRGLQVPVSLACQRPSQYQCQRHLERQWLSKPPPRRTITTKPLPGDPQTPPNQSTSKPLNPRRTRWRRLSNSPPTNPNSPPTTTPPSPPDDEFRQWRRSIFSITPDDEFQQWRDSIFHATPLPSIDEATSTPPRPDPSTQPAVLDISPLPPSLLDTDFQRLASPGHHVDGWTGGLVKVLPSLHPSTKDHQGQYFLFFDTLLAARSYADNLLNSTTTTSLSNPPPSPTSLTLLPPNLPRPRIHILSSTHLKSLLRRFYPPPGEARPPSNLAPRPENLHASVFHPERDDALAARVRVRLVGSWITAATLRAAIARDGRERGLAWGVVEGDGVVALAGSGAWVERGMFSVGGGAGVEAGGVGSKVRAYDRFVVTFEEAGEARRFVRGWHGREMLDRRNERVMGVEVLGLW